MKRYNQMKKYAVIAGTTALVTIGQAHAALDAVVVQASADEIAADGATMFGIMFAVVGGVLALEVAIKLFKRFGKKV